MEIRIDDYMPDDMPPAEKAKKIEEKFRRFGDGTVEMMKEFGLHPKRLRFLLLKFKIDPNKNFDAALEALVHYALKATPARFLALLRHEVWREMRQAEVTVSATPTGPVIRPVAPEPRPPGAQPVAIGKASHGRSDQERRAGPVDRRKHVGRRSGLAPIKKNSRFGRDRRANPIGRRGSDQERLKERYSALLAKKTK